MRSLYYPQNLPCPVVGFQKSEGDGRLRTRMGTGHFKTRRDVGLPIESVQGVNVRLSTPELAQFRQFWRSTRKTDGGVLPFLMRDKIYDGVKVLDHDYNILLANEMIPLLLEDGETELNLEQQISPIAGERESLMLESKGLDDDDFEPIIYTRWWLCVFGDQEPVIQRRGNARYLVSFSLEVMP